MPRLSHVAITLTGSGGMRLAQLLLDAGLPSFILPLIEFASGDDPDVRSALTAWPPTDWVVVTSPQGARALYAAGVQANWPLAAVGKSTAQELERLGFRVTFQPSRATGAVLGQELPVVAGQRVLHVTSDQAQHDLQGALHKRGVGYHRLVVYRTVGRSLSSDEQQALCEASVLVLASGTAARALAALVPLSAAVVVMGGQTARAARTAGFQRVFQATSPDLESLAEAVVAVWNSETGTLNQ